jgi:hypothetical protein
MITDDVRRLSDPATYRELGIEKKWRILRTFGTQCECVPYQDARDVQRVLDAVCGPENWTNEALSVGGKMYMNLGIRIGVDWVYKTDVGTESNIEKTKGEASDALKRAAVMWGVFRNLYDTDGVILNVKGKTPLTAGGKELKTSAQLSAYCNGLSSSMGHLLGIYNENRLAFESHPDAMKLLTGLKDFLNGIQE